MTDIYAAGAEELAPALDDSQRNRKAALVAGGVAVALVLGAGGWFLLGGGGDTTSNAAFVPGAVTPRAAGHAASKPATSAVKQLPAPYKAQLGRDPFKALYVVPAAAPAGTGTTTTGTGSTATGTTAGTGSTTPTTTGTGTTTPATVGSGTTKPTTTRYTLKLVSISKPSPEVRFTTWVVGGTNKTVIPAQKFGKYGELVVLAFGKNAAGVVDKAIIQVGDDSPIDVTVGESVSVL
jgi:hypothetical protein